MTSNTILNLSKLVQCAINHIQRRGMPVNVPPTATGKRRFRLAVETDPHKLVNYCCGLNYHIDEEPIKLKPDEEYPDWLWQLRLGPKPNSHEMEKGTKEYYLRLAEEGNLRNYLKSVSQARPKKIVSKVLKDKEEYLHHIRFNALAYLENEDAGYDKDRLIESDKFNVSDSYIKKRDYYLPSEDRVLYMDKIEGNIKLKNYFRDPDNSLDYGRRAIVKRKPLTTPAFQDSKRRHKHSVF